MFTETVCCGTDAPLNENFSQIWCIWHLLHTVCASPLESGLALPFKNPAFSSLQLELFENAVIKLYPL